MKKIKITLIVMVVLIVSAIAVMVFKNKQNASNFIDNEQLAEIQNINSNYDAEDENLSWQTDNIIYIDLNLQSKTTISKAGTYHFSGTTINGQIIVDVKDKEIVKIVLENANITCENSSSIYVKNADKVIIIAEEGTTNSLIDGTSYTSLDEAKEPNATIFSKDDLVINGKGTLNITANYEDGIVSKDDLKILNTTINIEANDDGIRGKDSVEIKNANITIKSKGDGIKSTEDTEAEKGHIIIEGGTYNITCEQDGIQAQTILKIVNGNFNINTGGGSVNSSSSNMGIWQKMPNSKQTGTVKEETISAKGIKGLNQIQIVNGTFIIDSSDDAIHSNGIIEIEDGTIEISSGDDGVHADQSITINGGKIDIKKSYEGIESATITINNGKITVVASDDGINISGGNDESSINGRLGQNNFSTTQNNNQILIINEGEIYVNASGDGLDANGSIYINGGNVFVDGPTNDGNGVLDYDVSCKVTGGVLVAAGSSGMLQSISSDSTQYGISIVYSTSQEAGTKVIIKDYKGEEIIVYTPQKVFSAVVISSPNLQKGETYTIYSGEVEFSTFTVNSITTSIGNSKTGGMVMNGEMQKGAKMH